MFKTCIYCNRSLGSNEVVENFPVGRRLAFDQGSGRLWVICGGCRRWNLSPLDERWEAIEECERFFYDTSQSFSTDNIGLARLPQGLDLVRIGKPRRPEFAAWRYGREFLRRRIRSAIVTGTKIAISVAGAMAGADIFWFFVFGGKKRVVARVRDEEGTRLCVVRKDLDRVWLVQAEATDGWSIEVPYRPVERIGLLGARGKGSRQTALISGPAAIRAAGHILPKVNAWGGSNSQVRSAVSLIEEARSPERLFERAATSEVDSRRLKKMDANVRLALEMAAHEESERRALEGELAILEAEWREAEEIGSIADRLLIPERVEELLLKFKRELRSDRPDP
jgi:hypothetical protein